MVNFICRVVVGDRLEVNHDENNPNRLVVLERNSSAKLGSNKDLFTDGPGPNNLLVQHEAVTLHHLSARAFSATVQSINTVYVAVLLTADVEY